MGTQSSKYHLQNSSAQLTGDCAETSCAVKMETGGGTSRARFADIYKLYGSAVRCAKTNSKQVPQCVPSTAFSGLGGCGNQSCSESSEPRSCSRVCICQKTKVIAKLGSETDCKAALVIAPLKARIGRQFQETVSQFSCFLRLEVALLRHSIKSRSNLYRPSRDSYTVLGIPAHLLGSQ